MSRLLEKVNSFRQNAQVGPVRVNVHNPSRSARAERLVMYACLVAAGVGLTAAQFESRAPAPKNAQAVRGQILDLSEPAGASPSAPSVDERMLQDDGAPRLGYVQVAYAGRQVLTLDEASRIHLAKQAADKNKLHSVGLSWRDVYGVIHAETAWIARDGMGKNGVVSSGLAQLEPNTAKGLSVSDPNDPVQAVHATATLMRDAAIWSRSKIAGLSLSASEKAAKLREGVSIYYNLSTRGRNTWSGLNTADLPIETQRHIQNSRDGARLAGSIEKRLAREQARQAQQDSPYLRASYGGRIDGAGPSVAAQLMAKIHHNDGFLAAAQAVQAVLTDKCAINGADKPTIDLNAACLATQPLVSTRLDAGGIDKLFPNMRLLGGINGTPVLMADDSSVDAGTLSNVRQDGSVAGAVAVSRGLVQALQGPQQRNHLQFVIGHELSHMALRHTFETDPKANLAQEMQADALALDYMRDQGISEEHISNSAAAVMDLLRRERPSITQMMTNPRADHLQDALMHQHEHQRTLAQR